jgi:hypothetical protein
MDLKIEEDVYKRFRQAKNLREFQLDDSMTVSEFLEEMLEQQFKKFDDLKILKAK